MVPKIVSIKTEPAGASVHQNGVMLCSKTPCKSALNRIIPRSLVIERRNYAPAIIQLPAFGFGWEELLRDTIVLESAVDDEDRQRLKKECLAKRETMPDPDNVDAVPCYRVPPIMPWRAISSGHCHVTFDVSNDGMPVNASVDRCTSEVFAVESLSVVSLWEYLPALKDGEPIIQKGVETKISFRLADEYGNLIPEPSLTHSEDSPESSE